MTKANEVGQGPIDDYFCGDRFTDMYKLVCRYYSGKRKRSKQKVF